MFHALWLTLTLATTMTFAAPLAAQQPAEDGPSPPIAGSQAGRKPPATKQTRRLPPFYARVVTSTQRLAIYDIQDKYQRRIEAIQAQIDALRGEMTTEIDRLLTPQQLKLLTDLKQQARRPPQIVAKPLEPPSNGAAPPSP